MIKTLTMVLVVSAAAFAAEVKTPAAPDAVATVPVVDTAKKVVLDTTKVAVDSAKAVVAPAVDTAKKAVKPAKSKK